MTGLDTNILVRFLTKDDPIQSAAAKEFLRTLSVESPGFISLVCLIELVWVLRSRYQLNKADLIQCLERLLDLPELILEGQTAVAQSLARFSIGKMDFADCLIERSGHLAGCGHTVTFDANAAKTSGMKLL
ncbi:MAG TPA: type II toxin-antitoxin system VapC family toxin [Terracidiphilus sp.]|jgi:predicted nucleic-acid-binding protein|nr:type II toxin-antitoxin system VapC family toxin [Terracidiphilus sp.]